MLIKFIDFTSSPFHNLNTCRVCFKKICLEDKINILTLTLNQSRRQHKQWQGWNLWRMINNKLLIYCFVVNVPHFVESLSQQSHCLQSKVLKGLGVKLNRIGKYLCIKHTYAEMRNTRGGFLYIFSTTPQANDQFHRNFPKICWFFQKCTQFIPFFSNFKRSKSNLRRKNVYCKNIFELDGNFPLENCLYPHEYDTIISQPEMDSLQIVLRKVVSFHAYNLFIATKATNSKTLWVKRDTFGYLFVRKIIVFGMLWKPHKVLSICEVAIDCILLYFVNDGNLCSSEHCLFPILAADCHGHESKQTLNDIHFLLRCKYSIGVFFSDSSMFRFECRPHNSI